MKTLSNYNDNIIDTNSKIKVMHLIWSMKSGGAQQVVINYFRDLSNDEDIELKLYVYNGVSDSKYDAEIQERNYNVEYLGNPRSLIKIPIIRWPFNRRIAKKTWSKVIREYNPDIVHVHISELLSVTLNPIIKNNVPIIFDTLHSNPYRYKGWKLRIIKKAFLKKKVIPVCLTDEQGMMAQEHYGIDKYELIRNGIDFNKIIEEKIDRKLARELLNVPQDAFIIIGVGRLSKIKNFDFLIRAFKCISEKKEKAILLIAGEGEERRNLEGLVEELGLENKVILLGNIEQMAQIYSAADVLGMPSVSEAAPLTLLEAQALGVKCVISSGVPKENIVNLNVKQMPKDADENEWAKALEEDILFTGVCSKLSEYDVHEISKNLKKMYVKYWENYANGK